MQSNPHVPDRLTVDRTALVVIDIQERFRDLIHGVERVLTNTERLIKFSQQLAIPVVVTEHYPRGLGVTVPEVRDVCEPFTPIEKIDFSCVGCGNFQKRLDELDRDQIILCGIETHVCVYQTAGDLLRQGKQVVAAVDAVSSCSAVNRELGLQAMRDRGVQILGTQMIMFEILQKAGTARFKQASNLLKE